MTSNSRSHKLSKTYLVNEEKYECESSGLAKCEVQVAANGHPDFNVSVNNQSEPTIEFDCQGFFSNATFFREWPFGSGGYRHVECGSYRPYHIGQ
jgi:hypothetical protein